MKYKNGDVFLIPSSGGGHYVGQVALDTKSEIGAPFCYIYDKSVSSGDGCESLELDSSQIISIAFITPELIEHRQWEICANRPVPAHPAIRGVDDLRKQGFVGAVIRGAGLVAEYLDTYYGVIDESVWPDPNYVLKFFLRPRSPHGPS